MKPCRRCGARLRDDARHCPRCHTPVTASDEEVADLLREVDAAGGLWHEPRTPRQPWRADERFLSPPPKYIESRTRKSALTFGLSGRIVFTAAILAVVLGAFLYSPSPGSGLIFGVVSVWFIKDVWKKARIRAPEDGRSQHPRT